MITVLVFFFNRYVYRRFQLVVGSNLFQPSEWHPFSGLIHLDKWFREKVSCSEICDESLDRNSKLRHPENGKTQAVIS